MNIKKLSKKILKLITITIIVLSTIVNVYAALDKYEYVKSVSNTWFVYSSDPKLTARFDGQDVHIRTATEEEVLEAQTSGKLVQGGMEGFIEGAKELYNDAVPTHRFSDGVKISRGRDEWIAALSENGIEGTASTFVSETKENVIPNENGRFRYKVAELTYKTKNPEGSGTLYICFRLQTPGGELPDGVTEDKLRKAYMSAIGKIKTDAINRNADRDITITFTDTDIGKDFSDVAERNEDGTLKAEDAKGSLRDAIYDILHTMFTLLFGPILALIGGLYLGWVSQFFGYLNIMMLDDFGASPAKFIGYFTGDSVGLLKVFTFVSMFILIAVLFFGFIQSMIYPLTDSKETPLNLIMRGLVFGFITYNAYSILGALTSVFGAIEDAVMGFASDGSISVNAFEQLAGSPDNISPLNVIIICVVFTLILWNLLKLFFEVIERWVFTCIMGIMAPVAFAFGASRSTSGITGTFMKTYIGQLFLLVINKWLLLAICAVAANPSLGGMKGSFDIESLVTRGLDMNAIVYLLTILAMIRVAQRFDDYMNNIGFSVARTGQGLTADLLTGIAMGRAMLGGITSAGRGVLNAGRTIQAHNAGTTGMAAAGITSSMGASASSISKDLDRQARQSGGTLSTIPSGMTKSQAAKIDATAAQKRNQEAAINAASAAGRVTPGSIFKSSANDAKANASASNWKKLEGDMAAAHFNGRLGLSPGAEATSASNLDLTNGTGTLRTADGKSFAISSVPKAGYTDIGGGYFAKSMDATGSDFMGNVSNAELASFYGSNLKQENGTLAMTDGNYLSKGGNIIPGDQHDLLESVAYAESLAGDGMPHEILGTNAQIMDDMSVVQDLGDGATVSYDSVGDYLQQEAMNHEGWSEDIGDAFTTVSDLNDDRVTFGPASAGYSLVDNETGTSVVSMYDASYAAEQFGSGVVMKEATGNHAPIGVAFGQLDSTALETDLSLRDEINDMFQTEKDMPYKVLRGKELGEWENRTINEGICLIQSASAPTIEDSVVIAVPAARMKTGNIKGSRVVQDKNGRSIFLKYSRGGKDIGRDIDDIHQHMI